MHSIRFVFTLLSVVNFITINYRVNGVCLSNQTEVTEPLVGASNEFFRFNSKVWVRNWTPGLWETYELDEQEYIYGYEIYRCVNFPNDFNDKASSVKIYYNEVFGFEHGNCQGDIACFQTITDKCKSLCNALSCTNAQVKDGNNFGSFNDKLSSALIRVGKEADFFENGEFTGGMLHYNINSCFNVKSEAKYPRYWIKTYGKCITVYNGANCEGNPIVTQCINECEFDSSHPISYKYCSF